MIKIKELRPLPKVVQTALDCYASNQYQQDQGCGSGVDKAEQSWLRARKALERWLLVRDLIDKTKA